MSTPPSPHSLHPDPLRSKRKDPPPALEFTESAASSDVETRSDRDAAAASNHKHQPRLHVRTIENLEREAAEADIPRSTSATSSLDPYYFGMHTPSESPVHPPTAMPPRFAPKTPDNAPYHTPITPGKDPASIDRRGLVGVGELATPRWARGERRDEIEIEIDEQVDELDEEDEQFVMALRDGDDDDDDAGNENDDVDVSTRTDVPRLDDIDTPDSPWTIEAIDGEADEAEEFLDVELPPYTPELPQPHLRSKRSVADESGGEEILYPRHRLDLQATQQHPMPSLSSSASALQAAPAPVSEHELAPPPSAFVAPGNRPRKRTSDEFELDYAGELISKQSSSSSLKDKDNTAARRHRSLGPAFSLPGSVSSSRDKTKERRRDTLTLNVRHAREVSASSSSSSHGESHHGRRLLASDYSHLPPSPGSSSIQQFLRHASTGSNPGADTGPTLHNSPREPPAHLATNVAHSLLRGTQEGWSDLDDQATAEALRKIDGIGSKGARARSSVGGHSRKSSTSRPGTPSKGSLSAGSGQRESVDVRRVSRMLASHTLMSAKEKAEKHGSVRRQSSSMNVGLGLGSGSEDVEQKVADAGDLAKEDTRASPAVDKPLKKQNSLRSSFTPKRGSGSSTTYTGTPTTTASSRDSASLSTGTSLTSVSAASGRQSNSKVKRSSVSSTSEVSNHSGDVASVRDRAAALAGADATEEDVVPPVPPLPKDFSSLKSHTHQSGSVAFPSSDSGEDRMPRRTSDSERGVPPEVHTMPTTPAKHGSSKMSTPTTASTQKTPSKKWSFSMPLGKKLLSSPSQSSMKDLSSSKSPGLALSPRALSFSHRSHKEQPLSPSAARKASEEAWTSVNTDAMASATSLASLSSIGSSHPVSPVASAPLPPIFSSKSPEHLAPSRPTTASSSSTNLTASMPPMPQQPLSPSSSIRRGPSTKRLTPSSIPFFRRSSSQSMQMPQPNMPSISPTYQHQPSGSHLRPPSSGVSPSRETAPLAPVTPSSSQKKSSGFGLGSLLKGSSSRRSLHSDKEKSDAKSAKEEARAAKEAEKERQKKEDKDRSESRISMLMGRKRGKTLSSVQPKKVEPVALPPMKISALPASTAQRVANLNSGSTSSLSSTQSTPKASRLTSQTLSSMQKQSDLSLRSQRNVLPTIAGSPSVGSLGHHNFKEPPPPSSLNASSALSKETPTKIPRISSRSSTTNSPTLKGNGGTSRRTSVIMGTSGVASSRGPSPSAGNDATEFGVLESGQLPKSTPSTTVQRIAVRGSPSTGNASARINRQSSTMGSTTVNGASTRKNRDSMSFVGLRKASTGSVASISVTASKENEPSTSSHNRLSALSPAKGLKLLQPKISLPTARISSARDTVASPVRNPASSPSPVYTDEDEMVGDEEMLQYIKRQHAKKLASGATQEELDELLKFPEPISPTAPAAPAAILKSNQVQYLSDYECKEILDYPSVYSIGARSEKKQATVENTHNNHGYDDDRGDYQVVVHDHLAYRYEVIGTLGKGSFGQVLHCRDHCTGESVAIKIIRNKKRFHHQALVEIKILDSLRKWDQEEKHHVIKMTEHFYFRGHLCIAMELLSINLYELIKANGFVGFSTTLIRRFTTQMLQSLALMRHHKIVHCDLKPENVLLRHPAKSAIKVIDFGSSCFEHEKIYTYIQSRFYRSPEVILGMNYHMAIDMWSLGCILAELYTGFPIFPGENEQEQLSCIMEVLGVPDKEFVNRSTRKRLFFDQTGAPRPCVNSKGRRRRAGSKTLAQVLRCDDADFVDFVAKCLVWDPERRVKPSAALRHPFIIGNRSRPKVTSPAPSGSRPFLGSSSNFSSSNRNSKAAPETPKKSLISAPTPLTARTSRVTSGVPTTPTTSNMMHAGLGSSSRSLRATQTQSMSYHSSHSSRTMLAK